ncbi:twin-arginine translocation signal domain-containing protein [Micromonospora halophytica]|uniref:Tat (Twin-arginine translocation) pathway signal sequence n=1 Tax=Micromonospora halophytica TaxID=47864 RepID=A0A1C5IXF8_9ACTN|nr:twin-arginine translocation signal domain-containing protein [Micromonospora halophytica]SCG62998.1 hypothetical protein GA0070560_1185 [Micromonospora halophytica]
MPLSRRDLLTAGAGAAPAVASPLAGTPTPADDQPHTAERQR